MNIARVRCFTIGIFSVGLMCACESLDVYDGPARPHRELAQIVGDFRVSAGLPVVITLRQIDEEDLGLRYRGAYVLPGEHDLLIDCKVTESQHISRHHLHVDVDAGVKYRLVADTGPGNQECRAVELISVD